MDARAVMWLLLPAPRVSRTSAGVRTVVMARDPIATVTPYRDGPYILRGPFELLDQDGNVIETRRSTIALCRCGRSQMRPFCDGTHKLTGFHAESEAERPFSAGEE